jgi:hypothetical protein
VQASLVCVCDYLGLFALGYFFFFDLLDSFHADSDVLSLVGDDCTGVCALCFHPCPHRLKRYRTINQVITAANASAT